MSFRSNNIVLPFLVSLFACLAPVAALYGQDYDPNPYTFTTLYGVAPGDSLRILDGIGSAARFEHPNSVAVDSQGNVYVSGSSYNHAIRKITAAGVVTTFAGSPEISGWANGTGTNAFFDTPMGVAVDGAGNLYVADTGNHTIRKITPAGVVTTLAGTAGSAGSTDATGSAARFNNPNSVAVDNAGNVYVSDSENFTIRKITPSGVVTTLAGSAGSYGYNDGTGSAAQFVRTDSIAVDSSGNVYVVSTNDSRIRKVTPTGEVTTYAGEIGSPGTLDGTGSNARFGGSGGIAADNSGNVYVGDTGNHTVRKIAAGAIVTTMAGTAGAMGAVDSTGSAARFSSPKGVAVDGAGNLYVADSENNTVRKITPAGVVTTLAGAAGGPGSADATGRNAQFNYPIGIAFDGSNNAYVADLNNRVIRKISGAGVVTTFAGTVGVIGYADGAGTDAQFNDPQSLSVDGSGNVFVADTSNHTIRKITAAGVVTTFAGLAGGPGSADGSGSSARFQYPSGVAVDGSGNLYVADQQNHTIRKITPAGEVTTFAGSAGNYGSNDGTGTAARFSYPVGLAVDGAGNLYVADVGNKAVRKITTGGIVTTIATFFSRVSPPTGVTVDSQGNVYCTLAGVANSKIAKVTSDGTVTIIGGASDNGWTDGTGSAALFGNPRGLAVDSSGKLYVVDSSNHTIRLGRPGPATAPTITLQPLSQNIAGSYPVTFSVIADGVPSPTYQWRKNGVNIIGATGSSYSIASVGSGDVADYTVVATNSVGSVTSNVAALSTYIAAPSGAVISIVVE